MSSPTTPAEVAPPASTRPASQLRLWPGVVILIVFWAVRAWASFGANTPGQFFFGFVVAPAAGALALLLWWLFASRLRWSDRLLIVGAAVVVSVATAFICGNDFPTMALILYGIPVAASAWVGWLLLTSRLHWPVRRAGLLVVFLLTGAFFTLLRIDGMDGSFAAKFDWRWTPTAEQRLLSDLHKSGKSTTKPEAKASKAAVPDITLQSGDWPDFRGPQRDGRLVGEKIRTNWEQSSPKEVWRHRIGPGWSSVTVVGKHVFTQEQRGDDEIVVCYDADTGVEVWTHSDATRFVEVVAGAGPRATPTFHDGRLYAQGANGKLNCLKPSTGELIWSKDIVADSGAKVPQWGYSGSPLVANGLVSVFAGGPSGKSVLAYNAETGDLAWSAGEGELSYSSTQLSKVCGVEQILICTDHGLTSYDPPTGKVLWDHPWPTEGIARVVQPCVLDESDILIGTGLGIGSRRIHVDHKGDTWTTKELWSTRNFKPYFNDFVVVDDHAYGIDGNIFMCVNLNDGKVAWRARGYGSGEVLLLADQHLLLILTETGDVVLVEAQPTEHKEVNRMKAIEGKSWNHPVVAHGKLFVRNAEEIACFDVSLKSSTETAEATPRSDP